MITSLNHLTLAVQEIDRSFSFYHEVLGLQPLVKWDCGAYFLVGEFWFCLNVDENLSSHSTEAANNSVAPVLGASSTLCTLTSCAPSTPPFSSASASLKTDSEKHYLTSCYTHYAFSVSQEEFETMSAKIVTSGVTLFQGNSSPGDSLYFLDPDGHKLEIHVSDWRARIAKKKTDPGSWKNIEWFV